MKITMAPKTAHFKSGILFFNLRETTCPISDINIQSGYDICFLFDTYAVYVAIDPSLEFGVMELKTEQMYGPYKDYMTVISLHLFGKYDNLISFLRDSFVFDDNLGAYQFNFNDFIYSRGVYDFTENITKATRELFDYLPAIHEPFVYEFTPGTFFADGVIETFVNKLNLLFNKNNFAEEVKENDNYIIGSTCRESGSSVRIKNGKAFFSLNLSKKRHSVYFIPKTVPVDYIDFVSIGTKAAEDIMYKYITSAPTHTDTNKLKVDYYKNKYNISSTIESVDIANYSLFDNVVLVLTPTDNPRSVFIFVKTKEHGITPIEFDPFTRKFTIFDKDYISKISDMMKEGNIKLSNDTLVFSFSSKLDSAIDNNDLSLHIKNINFSVECDKNRAFSKDGNIFSIDYAGNLLDEIFV